MSNKNYIPDFLAYQKQLEADQEWQREYEEWLDWIEQMEDEHDKKTL